MEGFHQPEYILAAQLDPAEILQRLLLPPLAPEVGASLDDAIEYISDVDRVTRMFGRRKKELVEQEYGARAPELLDILAPKFPTLRDVQQTLSEDELALVAFPSFAETLLISIRHNDVSGHVVPFSGRELGAVTARVRGSMQKFDKNSPPPLTDLQRLYDVTLRPIAPDLNSVQHIYWVGMSDYGTISPNIFHDGERYAIESHSFSSLPSLRALVDRKRDQPQAAEIEKFVGIGAIDISEETRQHGPSRTGDILTMSGGSRVSLPPLEYTWELLAKLGETIGNSQVLLRDEMATYDNIKNATQGADVIVFATHGLAGSPGSAFNVPGLQISPGAQHETETAWLRPGVIYSMDFSAADFVWLIACNTGVGNRFAVYEPFSGLVRAFKTAGASNVIASHWSLTQSSAVRLVPEVMGYIADGDRVGKALQKAMVNALNDADPFVAHPGFWGALTIVGDR